MSGKGIFYHSSGNKYDGEWKDGEKYGEGEYLWKDGTKYIGSWKNGTRNGKGPFFKKAIRMGKNNIF
jgi:hypothetical protein